MWKDCSGVRVGVRVTRHRHGHGQEPRRCDPTSPIVPPQSAMSADIDTPEAGPSTGPSTGPSSPRPTIHVSAPDQTGAGPSQPVEPATPAPSNRVEVVPAAPPHALPARDLPTATPSTSATPTTRPGPDISEFDPFATPMPGSTQGQERARPALQPSPLAQSTPVHTTAARQEAAAQSPSRQTRGGSAGSSDGAAVTLPGATTTDSGLSEPAFNFSGFLKDLRLKSAEPVARYLKRCAGMDPS